MSTHPELSTEPIDHDGVEINDERLAAIISAVVSGNDTELMNIANANSASHNQIGKMNDSEGSCPPSRSLYGLQTRENSNPIELPREQVSYFFDSADGECTYPPDFEADNYGELIADSGNVDLRKSIPPAYLHLPLSPILSSRYYNLSDSGAGGGDEGHRTGITSPARATVEALTPNEWWGEICGLLHDINLNNPNAASDPAANDFRNRNHGDFRSKNGSSVASSQPFQSDCTRGKANGLGTASSACVVYSNLGNQPPTALPRSQSYDRLSLPSSESRLGSSSVGGGHRRGLAGSGSASGLADAAASIRSIGFSGRRKNLSFSNMKLWEIERENRRLLSQIKTKRAFNRNRPVEKRLSGPPKALMPDPPKRPSSPVMERNYEQMVAIHSDNLHLLSRIQSAQPSRGLSRKHLASDYIRNKHLGTLRAAYSAPASGIRSRVRPRSASAAAGGRYSPSSVVSSDGANRWSGRSSAASFASSASGRPPFR